MKDRLINTLDKSLALAVAFILCFLSIRLFGWLSISDRIGDVNQIGLQLQGLLEDISVGIIITLLVAVIGQLFTLLSTRIAVIIEIIMFLIVLATAFSINEYFNVTLVPLSTELFGYTARDVSIAINSSGGTDNGPIIKLISILILFGSGVYFSLRKNYFGSFSVTKKVVGIVAIFLFTLLPTRAIPEDFESDVAYNIKVNKLWHLFSRSLEYWKEDSAPIVFEEDAYPFLHHVNYEDSLSNYFNRAEGYPNLVFIIVEGLGRDFCGPGARYGGFTPFLDSLSAESLYWQNAMSNAGRTFGAPPSILGSLPYGKLGMMGYGNEMPNHQTLITLLKPYGYGSNFFYGGNPNFDNLDLFLERNGIDFFLNESNFPSGSKKDSWGYNDQLLFNIGFAKTEKEKNNRLDIYLTLSTHEPFACPDSNFILRADRMVDHYSDLNKKEVMLANKNIFECLLYTDHAISSFITNYSKRPDFSKTIFVITGDHRLIPMPQDNKIERFHVPILIYSPLLKRHEVFSSVVTHSSILPSILSLFKSQYGMVFPNELPIISNALSLKKNFSSDLHIPLIRNKNEINDFISGDYFLSNNRLYSILPDLQLKVESKPEIKAQLKRQLLEFQAKSLYAISNNRLDKTSEQSQALFSFNKDDEKYLTDEKIISLDPDKKFNKAQVLARTADYQHCRTILKNILSQSPNYHDARNLLARTYAWEKHYDSAKVFLNQTLKRSPNYADTYAALSDINFWQNNLKQSLTDVDNGLKSNPKDAELLSRKARALLALNHKSEAKKIITDLVKSGFENEIVVQLKSKLK